MSEYSSDERTTEALECVCTHPAHMLTAQLDLGDREDLDDPTLSLAVQLSPFLPWYKRVYQATRYVLGIRDTVWGGHWDVCMLDKKSAEKLQSLLTAWTVIRKLRAHQRKAKGIKHYV